MMPTRTFALTLAALATSGCEGIPSMLRPASDPAGTLSTLGWWLLGIATVVSLVVILLSLVPLRWRETDLHDTPLGGEGGTRGVLVGVIATVVILVGVWVYTIAVLDTTSRPDREPDVTIRLTGHQWWWEGRYVTEADADTSGITANEFHIPVGEPVRLVVESADVIHSFWAPRLHGKIDVIPGRPNVFWIRADEPGRYLGQCAEFCGTQHAHMDFRVIARPRPEFERWLAHIREPAAEPPAGSAAARGKRVFMSNQCISCHAIRGTEAEGYLGPDLTHVAARETIAAGMFPNREGYMAPWVVNAPSMKPGVKMPAVALAPEELHAVVAYMQSLR